MQKKTSKKELSNIWTNPNKETSAQKSSATLADAQKSSATFSYAQKNSAALRDAQKSSAALGDAQKSSTINQTDKPNQNSAYVLHICL